jgi:CheY-like chemotaxis protein
MEGPDATSLLRKAGYSGIVIGLTGNVLQDDVDHFLRSGADAVLSKPLNIPE